MRFKRLWKMFAIIVGVFINSSLGFMKFTNVECRALTELMSFKKCRIDAMSFEMNGFSMHAALTRSVNNISISFKIMKKANGWRKFMYDFNDINACSYLRNTKKHPLLNFIYEYQKRFSNINHTCPYNHDIIINRMSFNTSERTPVFPLGKYALMTTWKAYGERVAMVNVYLEYADYLRDW